MSTLPKQLRDELPVKVGDIMTAKSVHSISCPQTEKFLLELQDGQRIEAVAMEFLSKEAGKNWVSLCISSQVGCGLGCVFCSTGTIGFKRNLSVDEIVAQPLWAHLQGHNIHSIALMGMGEPLANPNVFSALEIFTDHELFNVSPRRISLSTTGIVPQLITLVKRFPNINVALSLHSPFQHQREELMPVAKTYALDDIFRVLDQHIIENKRKVFLAYVMLRGINDSIEHANALADLIKKRGQTAFLYHVNLIRYHKTTISGKTFESSDGQRIREFQSALEQQHIPVTIRKSFGESIEAACGQLYANYKSAS